jgi:MFS transporter, MHS family, citrate/tricarballylate:H+ symporter
VILSKVMAPDAREAYGWRIAFLLGAVCLPFWFWMRWAPPETIEHVAVAGERASHLSLARPFIRVILLAIVILASGTISTYLTQYMTTYPKTRCI